ncbi:MAG: hypothetical protein Kow00108_20540 [Calditrichia bacterium]
MSDSLTHIYVYIIFSVKYRKNLILENLRPLLFCYIAGIARNKKCRIIEIGWCHPSGVLKISLFPSIPGVYTPG